MNRIVIYAHELQEINGNYSISFSDYRLEHLQKILRSKEGDTLKFTLIGQGLCQGQIQQIGAKGASIQLQALPNEKERTPSSQVAVAISYCRPPSVKKIIEHGSTLGITDFYFYPSALTEKSYAKSHIWAPQSLQHLMELGLAQSGCYDILPTVHHLNTLSQLKVLAKNFQHNFLLAFNTQKNFSSKMPILGKTLLVFGPERGLTLTEESLLLEDNFQAVSISKSILRVEQALFHAIGQIELLKNSL